MERETSRGQYKGARLVDRLASPESHLLASSSLTEQNLWRSLQRQRPIMLLSTASDLCAYSKETKWTAIRDMAVADMPVAYDANTRTLSLIMGHSIEYGMSDI